MGAWGEEMMANDTALDYQPSFNEEVVPLLVQAKHQEGIKKAFDIAMEHDSDGRWGYHSTLAAIQLLLDLYIDPKLIREDERAEKAISEELGEHLQTWSDKAARKSALEILQKRLQGKKLTPADEQTIIKANRALFAKLNEKAFGGEL